MAAQVHALQRLIFARLRRRTQRVALDVGMQDIRYSPHFNVFCSGRKVDEFHGADAQRLRDRMWLHNERRASAQEAVVDRPESHGGLLGLLRKR